MNSLSSRSGRTVCSESLAPRNAFVSTRAALNKTTDIEVCVVERVRWRVLLSGRVVAACVCRYSGLQPAGVDPRALLPRCAGDGLVARRAALRHAVRRHSVRTRRADHEG